MECYRLPEGKVIDATSAGMRSLLRVIGRWTSVSVNRRNAADKVRCDEIGTGQWGMRLAGRGRVRLR